MNLSLCLWALTATAGQYPQTYAKPYEVIQPVASYNYVQPVAAESMPYHGTSCSCPCSRPTLGDRLRNFFGKLGNRGCSCSCNCEPPSHYYPQPHEACMSCEPAQVPATLEPQMVTPPQVLPDSAQAEPEEAAEVPVVSYREPALAAAAAAVSRASARMGHAADYSWVIGRLVRINADGGLWVVRYAGVEEEDRFGGSVVLTSASSLKDLREGDLVRVHGEVLNEGRATRHCGGPLYRALTLELVDRPEVRQNLSYSSPSDQ